MSTDREVNRIVRSWLEEGATALPDRVLDAVLDQIPATPQRRSWWPARRLQSMNNVLKVLIPVAAVIGVAVVSFNVLAVGGGLGASASTASPTPSPMPLPSAARLGAGTYYIDAGAMTPGRFTVTVPDGWAASEGFIYREGGDPGSSPAPNGAPGGVELSTWIVSTAFSDACHWREPLVSVGPTIDSLVAVLAVQKGRTASTVTDTEVGGFPAKRIELTVPADLDLSTCANGTLRFWPDTSGGGLCCGPAGSTDVVYVVDVAGKPLAIVARHDPDSPASDVTALDAIVASIRIDPPPASPSPRAVSPSP